MDHSGQNQGHRLGTKRQSLATRKITAETGNSEETETAV